MLAVPAPGHANFLDWDKEHEQEVVTTGKSIGLAVSYYRGMRTVPQLLMHLNWVDLTSSGNTEDLSKPPDLGGYCFLGCGTIGVRTGATRIEPRAGGYPDGAPLELR